MRKRGESEKEIGLEIWNRQIEKDIKDPEYQKKKKKVYLTPTS